MPLNKETETELENCNEIGLVYEMWPTDLFDFIKRPLFKRVHFLRRLPVFVETVEAIGQAYKRKN